MERLKRLAYIACILTFGFVLICLYGAIVGQIQIAPDKAPLAYLGAIIMAAIMITIFLKVALVPDRRVTGWVRGLITNVNGKWFFGILLIIWVAVMALLASQDLPGIQVGGLALLGLFAGIFVFMGFIWAVIGE
jgi:hypothetical protein